MPFMSPADVIVNKSTGRISHLMLARTEQVHSLTHFILFHNHIAADPMKDANPRIWMTRVKTVFEVDA